MSQQQFVVSFNYGIILFDDHANLYIALKLLCVNRHQKIFCNWKCLRIEQMSYNVVHPFSNKKRTRCSECSTWSLKILNNEFNLLHRFMNSAKAPPLNERVGSKIKTELYYTLHHFKTEHLRF